MKAFALLTRCSFCLVYSLPRSSCGYCFLIIQYCSNVSLEWTSLTIPKQTLSYYHFVFSSQNFSLISLSEITVFIIVCLLSVCCHCKESFENMDGVQFKPVSQVHKNSAWHALSAQYVFVIFVI